MNKLYLYDKARLVFPKQAAIIKEEAKKNDYYDRTTPEGLRYAVRHDILVGLAEDGLVYRMQMKEAVEKARDNSTSGQNKVSRGRAGKDGVKSSANERRIREHLGRAPRGSGV